MEQELSLISSFGFQESLKTDGLLLHFMVYYLFIYTHVEVTDMTRICAQMKYFPAPTKFITVSL